MNEFLLLLNITNLNLLEVEYPKVVNYRSLILAKILEFNKFSRNTITIEFSANRYIIQLH